MFERPIIYQCLSCNLRRAVITRQFHSLKPSLTKHATLESQKDISNRSPTGTKLKDELLRDERYDAEEIMDMGPSMAGGFTRNEHDLSMSDRAGFVEHSRRPDEDYHHKRNMKKEEKLIEKSQGEIRKSK